MKRKTYLERASRALGAETLLVPPRRLWSSSRDRRPPEQDQIPVATPGLTPARALHHSTASEPAIPPSRADTGVETAEAALMRASGRFAALAFVEATNRDAGRPNAETGIGNRGRTAGGDAAAAMAAKTTDGSGTTVIARATGSDGGAIVIGRTSGRNARAPAASRSAPSAAVAASSGVAHFAIADAEAIEPIPPAPFSQVQDDHPMPRRGNERKSLSMEGTITRDEDVSVRIGAIDVIVEPPPRPIAARPALAPLQPLARGFLSTFGLRQG